MIVAAGSSPGAFYLHFHNKEDVFAAALKNVGERISAAINDAVRAVGGNPVGQMRVAVAALVRFLAEK